MTRTDFPSPRLRGAPKGKSANRVKKKILAKLFQEVFMKEIICETSNCEHNLKCKCLAG